MHTLIPIINIQELEVLVFENRKIMGRAAAQDAAACIISVLKSKEELNIIFAAAPSQNDFLEALLQHNLPWNQINAFHMDEYVGLPAAAPQAFGNFLRERIFDKVPFKSINYLNGGSANPSDECERYADLLSRHPVDIVCMGIGENGHIAFNDPPVADFNDPLMVKKVTLDAMCRQQQVNDGCFRTLDKVPEEALTLTVPALLDASFVFSIVPGKTKAAAVKNTLLGPVEENCPASILQKHKNARLYLDPESFSDSAAVLS
jgi:glucosamine-6-phosphate deaminase